MNRAVMPAWRQLGLSLHDHASDHASKGPVERGTAARSIISSNRPLGTANSLHFHLVRVSTFFGKLSLFSEHESDAGYNVDAPGRRLREVDGSRIDTNRTIAYLYRQSRTTQGVSLQISGAPRAGFSWQFIFGC